MSIVKYQPTVDKPIHSPLDSIQSENYLSVVADDSHQPINSLLGYISGAPWSVDYYSQILSRDNDLRDQDTYQSQIYQPYKKVIDLELRVETPINQGQQEEESAVMSVTGSALMYPCVIPNPGDMFVATAGNLHRGIYRITTVERKSFNRSSVYAINYDLQVFINNDPENRYQDLESKVLRTYYFYKDRLISGLNPLVLEQENAAYRDLGALYQDLCKYYCKTFWSIEHSTLIVPGQGTTLYDAYVVDYLLKIVSIPDAPEIPRIRNLGTDLDPYMAQPTLWTALLERNIGVLDYCHTEMGVVTYLQLGNNAMLKGLRFSNIRHLVYPKTPDTSVNSTTHLRPKLPSLLEFIETPDHPIRTGSPLDDAYVDVNETIPYVPGVMASDYYVFTEAFYARNEPTSLIEVLTTQYLSNESMDSNRLHALGMHAKGFSRLDQFYYIPIILTLLKAAIYDVR